MGFDGYQVARAAGVVRDRSVDSLARLVALTPEKWQSAAVCGGLPHRQDWIPRAGGGFGYIQRSIRQGWQLQWGFISLREYLHPVTNESMYFEVGRCSLNSRRETIFPEAGRARGIVGSGNSNTDFHWEQSRTSANSTCGPLGPTGIEDAKKADLLSSCTSLTENEAYESRVGSHGSA